MNVIMWWIWACSQLTSDLIQFREQEKDMGAKAPQVAEICGSIDQICSRCLCVCELV